MTDGLSRRDLVLSMGTAMASAALQPARDLPASVTEYPLGVCEDWGWSPAIDPDRPVVLPQFQNKYNPQYIALVFIDFVENWKIEINHASFGPNNWSEPDRLRKAIQVLQERGSLTQQNRRFKNLTAHRPYERKGDGTLDRTDFTDFGFSKQNEIFIYFNSNDVILNPDLLITFTPLSQDGDDRDKNFSFLKARLVDSNQMMGVPGRLIRLRNYVLDEDYSPIGIGQNTRKQMYSMNIHFRLKSGGQHVAMIIDPDTGNGQGNEP